MIIMVSTNAYARLETQFQNRFQKSVPLARFTAARIGGSADGLLVANSVEELVEIVEALWAAETAFLLIGGGSNILVSDRGVRAVVVINKARGVQFYPDADPPYVEAESGANFGIVARQAALKGLAGLAWAAGIPGTIGGAVVGNAGAHGADMVDNLIMADILHHTRGREKWERDRFEFAYRTSVLKRNPGETVVLGATLRLETSSQAVIQETMNTHLTYRRRTQPPGASMGSMFKNPPGDYAGRLIEAAGLKGMQIGGAQISPLHGNFFINLGEAKAGQVKELIDLARRTVETKFGVRLELEVELVGDWSERERDG
jgi:UDP-N-acetylmuramate dehydrogenase